MWPHTCKGIQIKHIRLVFYAQGEGDGNDDRKSKETNQSIKIRRLHRSMMTCQEHRLTACCKIHYVYMHLKYFISIYPVTPHSETYSKEITENKEKAVCPKLPFAAWFSIFKSVNNENI